MKWNSQESSLAIALRQQLKTYPQIGAVIGRSEQQVARFFKRLAERGRDFGPKNAAASTLTRAGIGRVDVPQDVLFDCERRLKASYIQPAAARICGDPVVPRWRSNATPPKAHPLAIFGAALLFGLLVALSPAHAGFASEYGRGAAPRHYGAHADFSALPVGQENRHRASHAVRYARNLPEPCRRAAALGGPCGCWASVHFFGESVRALWPVSQWVARFERTSARANVAAIWPGRHVAPTVSDPHNGRIMVADSWGTHEVSTAGLIFVDPRSARGCRMVLAQLRR